MPDTIRVVSHSAIAFPMTVTTNLRIGPLWHPRNRREIDWIVVTDAPRTPARLRPEIMALPAYKQGRAAAEGGYKLSSNENPFDPLPGVLEAVARASAINRYPDAAATELRGRLAERYGVTPDEGHVGAGSVALLSQFIDAAAGPGDEVLYAWRSFEAYPGLVTVAGAQSVRIPLLPDGRHDLDAMAAAVNDRTRTILVCTPNNPTGCIVTAREFERFMAAVPESVLVLLDEAYVEFVRDPAAVDGATLLGRYPNLVVLRTFSKAWGLAGLRLGYAIGPAPLLDAARAAAIPLSVTAPALAAGDAALDAEEELTARARRTPRCPPRPRASRRAPPPPTRGRGGPGAAGSPRGGVSPPRGEGGPGVSSPRPPGPTSGGPRWAPPPPQQPISCTSPGSR